MKKQQIEDEEMSEQDFKFMKFIHSRYARELNKKLSRADLGDFLTAIMDYLAEEETKPVPDKIKPYVDKMISYLESDEFDE